MANDTQEIRPQDRVLNVQADPPDIRDRMYEPPLIPLEAEVLRPQSPRILDQANEGACTGFGLAATINGLLQKKGIEDAWVSQRMLYEMAKLHDEWPGQDYEGSSCRGAIRGWANMGVCRNTEWRFVPNQPGRLTIGRAKAARERTLGAYYRVRPNITDYHAALSEAGVLYASAKVHNGWFAPKGKPKTIKPGGAQIGGHAFAIVGYNGDGFWVQNSWGPGWGDNGVALWLYEDWLDNVTDCWAVRLAVPVPQIFGVIPKSSMTTDDSETADWVKRKAPKRIEIAGHFIHFDDGFLKQKGNFWSTIEDIAETAELTKNSSYDHLLVYAHGGLNSPAASAKRIRALRDGFKRNGIYPMHIMYDTGLAEEISDVIRRALGLAEKRAAGFTDWLDGFIEDAVRKPVTPLWDEMKRDAYLPFEKNTSDGSRSIQLFAKALQGTGKSIHIAGHSTGGVLIGHLLNALKALGMPVAIETLSLFAPACRKDFFEANYVPYLGASAPKAPKIKQMTVYNLTGKLEKDDQVAFAYRKSLLYLVSRALERGDNVPLLGMQKYSQGLPKLPGLEFVYSDGRGERSASATHGGFDNDLATMNDLLARILGKKPPPSKLFTEVEMKGY